MKRFIIIIITKKIEKWSGREVFTGTRIKNNKWNSNKTKTKPKQSL